MSTEQVPDTLPELIVIVIEPRAVPYTVIDAVAELVVTVNVPCTLEGLIKFSVVDVSHCCPAWS